MANNALPPSLAPIIELRTEEEEDEYNLFLDQPMFESARETRRRLYREKVQQMDDDFEAAEITAQNDIFDRFTSQVRVVAISALFQALELIT